MSFGQELRRRRLEAGLTQEDLAERAAVSVRGLSDLERGIRQAPYPDTVERLVTALGLDEMGRAALLQARRRLAVPDIRKWAGRRRTSPDGAEARHNLTIEPTRLIGRERLVQRVRQLLLEPDVSLLTLTGAGGSGKTRVAVAVGALLRDTFSDGVWLVELAAVTDPDLVPSVVAASMGVTDRPGRSARVTLQEVLQTRSALLVFDNCEHLVDSCAALADELLRKCDGLRILATSRERLRIPGERTLQVPTLPHPDPRHMPALEELARYAAVQLFVERTQSIQHAFALNAHNCAAVAGICARLDGLPLAIELAAARMQVLAPDQILERLDDTFRLLVGGSRTSPTRQQTLKATLDWSWDLLREPEQMLFRRLGVFAGGWTLEESEAICGGDGLAHADVLELLARLLEKSIVTRDEREEGPRYRLLDPLRQYANDRLCAAGAESVRVRRRHAAYFQALAEAGGPKVWSSDQELWLERLERDHDNFRTAIVSSAEFGDYPGALRMATALMPFWEARGHVNEGQRRLEQALTDSIGTANARERVLATVALADLLLDGPENRRAMVLLEESLMLCRDLRDSRQVARVLNCLGIGASNQGDHARAIRCHEESLALAQDHGDVSLAAFVLNNMGVTSRRQGDYGRAKALFEESLSTYRAFGKMDGVALALDNLGSLALDEGDHQQASRLIEESLTISRRLGLKPRIAESLLGLGRAVCAVGEFARAAALLAESLRLIHELGDTVGLAQCFEAMGRLAGAERRPRRAAHLLGAAAALRVGLGHPLPQPDRVECDRWIDTVRSMLGAERFDTAWQQGRETPVLATVEFALSPMASPTRKTSTVERRDDSFEHGERDAAGDVLSQIAWPH